MRLHKKHMHADILERDFAIKHNQHKIETFQWLFFLTSFNVVCVWQRGTLGVEKSTKYRHCYWCSDDYKFSVDILSIFRHPMSPSIIHMPRWMTLKSFVFFLKKKIIKSFNLTLVVFYREVFLRACANPSMPNSLFPNISTVWYCALL